MKLCESCNKFISEKKWRRHRRYGCFHELKKNFMKEG